MLDFILNGQATGSIAGLLLANGFDTDALRPYLGKKDNLTYITRNSGEFNEDGTIKKIAVPTFNATATLRKDEWKILDDAVIQVARPYLRAVGDVRGRGLELNLGTGMGKTILEHQTMSDLTDAMISMDALRSSDRDRPEYDIAGLPLPIISKDFQFTARQLATGRQDGTGIDTTAAEVAGRKVAEMAEKMLLGEIANYKFGGYYVYGYTTFPNRLTATLTDPTGAWTPADTVSDVLAMIAQLQGIFMYGPYMLYASPGWSQYLDDDYSSAKGDNTLRERLRKIEDIEDVRTLPMLSDMTLLLVQMTSDVIREVVSMEIQTVQWPTHGGLEQNFKVMAMITPQIREDQNDATGICHGTV